MEFKNDRLHLTVGETYNFFKNSKDFWIVEVLESDEDRYLVEILKRVGPDQKYREGQTGFIGIRSTMFSTYQITKYHKADIHTGPDPDIEKEINDLLNHVQKQFEISQLEELIDASLRSSNREAFIDLTSQLNKLKGVAV